MRTMLKVGVRACLGRHLGSAIGSGVGLPAMCAHLLRGPATGRIHQAGRYMPLMMGMRSSREGAQATRRQSTNWTVGTGSPLDLLRHIRAALKLAPWRR